jgi:hypothetical protein
VVGAGNTVDSAVGIVPPVAVGAGSAVNYLGNTLGIDTVGVTGLVGDLLDITLDTVSDVLTSATIALHTVSAIMNVLTASNSI